MFRNHPDPHFVPLTDPQEVATWAAGRSVSWKLNGVPTTLTVAGRTKLAVLAGFAVTFSGKCGYSSITGSPRARYRDDFTLGLLRDAEVQKVWHGVPVAATNHKAEYMTAQEYLDLGGEFYARGPTMSANANWGDGQSEEFVHSMWIGVSDLLGEKGWHSCLPALCYRNGTLKLNFADAGRVTDDAGNVLQFTDDGEENPTPEVRVTAVLLAVDEIIVAPPGEWRAFESAPSPNSDVVMLTGLAGSSLEGVQGDAAIEHMLIMTDARNVGAASGGADCNVPVGSFTADTLTRWSCSWLDQEQTGDIKPLLVATEKIGTAPGRDFGPGLTDERHGFPMCPGADITKDGDGRIGLMFVAALAAGHDSELTKLPRVNGTQKYNRQVTIIEGNSDITLVKQRKPWNRAKLEDLKRILLQSGDAAAVLNGETELRWEVLPKGRNQSVSQADARYLPWRLVPVNEKSMAGR